MFIPTVSSILLDQIVFLSLFFILIGHRGQV